MRGLALLGETLENMDRAYIISLSCDIKWLVGYQGRHKYDLYPSFKEVVVVLDRELRVHKKRYKEEWGRLI